MVDEMPHEGHTEEDDDHLLRAISIERKKRKDAEEKVKAKEAELEALMKQFEILRVQLDAEVNAKANFNSTIKDINYPLICIL